MSIRFIPIYREALWGGSEVTCTRYIGTSKWDLYYSPASSQVPSGIVSRIVYYEMKGKEVCISRLARPFAFDCGRRNQKKKGLSWLREIRFAGMEIRESFHCSRVNSWHSCRVTTRRSLTTQGLEKIYEHPTEVIENECQACQVGVELYRTSSKLCFPGRYFCSTERLYISNFWESYFCRWQLGKDFHDFIFELHWKKLFMNIHRKTHEIYAPWKLPCIQ